MAEFADGFVNHLAESDGTSSIVGTVKSSGAGINNSSSLLKTLQGNALSTTSVTDLVVVGSVKVDGNFASLLYSYPL